MKAFGLEIRRADTIQNLYQGVDATLKKYNISQREVDGYVQMLTVAHALQKMMQSDKWFDVCTIDACIRVTQTVVQRERYDIYRAAHCIHWNEMLPEYREVLIAMVLDDFRSILNPLK